MAKSKEEIKKRLREEILNQPHMMYEEGWIDALRWVLDGKE